MSHNVIKITNRDPSTSPIIAVGAFVGIWGYFFLKYLPMLVTLRQQHPNAFIVGAGYLSDWWYLRDICDAYIGFPVDHSLRRTIGWNEELRTTNTNEDLTDTSVKNIIAEHFGECDKYYHMQNDDATVEHMLSTFVTSIPVIGHELGEPSGPTSNKIGIWGRMKPGGRTTSNGSTEHWEKTIDYLVDAGYEVSVLGMKTGSFSSTNGKVKVLTDLHDTERAYATITEARSCLATLHDCSSTINYCQVIGVPAMVFNCNPRDEFGFRNHSNIFGTLTDFYNHNSWEKVKPAYGANIWQDNPNANLQWDEYHYEWYTALEKFICRCRTEPAFTREVSTERGIFSYMDNQSAWMNLRSPDFLK